VLLNDNELQNLLQCVESGLLFVFLQASRHLGRIHLAGITSHRLDGTVVPGQVSSNVRCLTSTLSWSSATLSAHAGSKGFRDQERQESGPQVEAHVSWQRAWLNVSHLKAKR